MKLDRSARALLAAAYLQPAKRGSHDQLVQCACCSTTRLRRMLFKMAGWQWVKLSSKKKYRLTKLGKNALEISDPEHRC